MSHTPSPLTIHLSKATRADMAGDYGIADAHGKIVGEAFRTVGYGEENQRPAEANARLWAAAPTMLRALLDLTSYLYATQNPGTLPAEWDRAQDAIALATGRPRQI